MSERTRRTVIGNHKGSEMWPILSSSSISKYLAVEIRKPHFFSFATFVSVTQWMQTGRFHSNYLGHLSSSGSAQPNRWVQSLVDAVSAQSQCANSANIRFKQWVQPVTKSINALHYLWCKDWSMTHSQLEDILFDQR